MKKTIKDLLYFDLQKSISLYSQMDEGIITQSTENTEEGGDINSSLGVDVKIFQAKIGASANDKESKSTTRIPHHNLLNKLQENIYNSKSYIDLDKIDDLELDSEKLHQLLKSKSFIKATGWVNIEDYDRLKKIAKRFNSISQFIQQCSIADSDEKEQYDILIQDLKKQRKLVNSQKDRNVKTKDNIRLNKLEDDLEKLLDEYNDTGKIPEYLVNGIQLFIDTFLPDRINFRFYPYENLPSFEILSNLKRKHFVETDIENITFSYGSRPNLKMTIFGMITSLPEKDEELFDPLKKDLEEGEESIVFERAFRGVFRGFEGFEQFVRYSSFPRITVNPLAVYREIEL
jgi:hypothetical protein